jgi:predicted nucleotide-binding protein (sugar kinase/HSP70/actin superfamily)
LRIGLPRGLYYYKFDTFLDRFLKQLEIDVVISPETNKKILIDGLNSCVDDACLPIKIFHGHIMYLRDKCDLIIVPRIMEYQKSEYICPKFCGLPEMLKYSIPGLPQLTLMPLYTGDINSLYKWCSSIGHFAGVKPGRIKDSFWKAYEKYKLSSYGLNDETKTFRVALLGHPYIIYDKFVNMDVVKKLDKLDTGVITQEFVQEEDQKEVYHSMLIYPFWSCIKETLGAGNFFARNGMVDGIIYLSSFQCGIDSVIIDLLKDLVQNIPLLVLKFDEHSGEAGLETRLEAFIDMIKRRKSIGNYVPSYGQHIFGS